MILKSTLLNCFSAVLIGTFGTSCYLFDFDRDKSAVSSDIQFLAGVGSSTTDTATDGDPNFTGDLDESDTTITLGVSTEVNEHVGFNLKYIDFGNVEFDGMFAGGTSIGSVQRSGVELSATGRYPLGANFSATGTVGILMWDGTENETFAGAPLSTSDSGFDPLFGIGIENAITPNITTGLSYTRYLDVFDDNVDAIVFEVSYGL